MKINHRPQRCLLYYMLASVVLAGAIMSMSAVIVGHHIHSSKSAPIVLSGDTEIRVPEVTLVADSGM